MRKKFHILVALCLVALGVPAPLRAWAGDQGDVATISSLEGLFTNILGAVIRLMGVATFIMIIVGGFKYLTAGGDPKAVESAQGTITQGVIGLVLAIAAWFIIAFIANLTGVKGILEFNVGLP